MGASYNKILGTETADFLMGTSGADSISALQGNDRIDGRGGADLLFGGRENDVLTSSGASSQSSFYGNKGNDLLKTGPSNSSFTSFFGGVGNDSLTMGSTEATDAYLSGDADADFIFAETLKSSTVYGGNSTGIFADREDGNDTLELGLVLANSFVNGNAGADSIVVASLGNSTVHGGTGDDIIIAEASAQSSSLFGDKGSDNITVGNGNKTLIGDAVYGDFSDTSRIEGAGNDTILYNAGDSLISLATVAGGFGADSIRIDGGKVISTKFSGDEGDDVFTSNASEIIQSTIYGGSGNDKLQAGDFTSQEKYTLISSTYFGGLGDDSLFIATLTSSAIRGEAGNDLLEFQSTNSSTLHGGSGADTIGAGIPQTRGRGTDYSNTTVVGGEGDDLLLMNGAFFNDVSVYFTGISGGSDTIDAGYFPFATTSRLLVSDTFGATSSYTVSNNNATITFGAGSSLTVTNLDESIASSGVYAFNFQTVSQSSIDALG